jgi:hypothetical protein
MLETTNERRTIGWRVKSSAKGWVVFISRQRAESFAEETNAMLQECYDDGTVQTIRCGNEQSADYD